MKRIFVLLLLVCGVLTIYGCSKNHSEEDLSIQKAAEDDTVLSGIEFLNETYGITEEELHNVDVERFIDDYQLRRLEYTKDEILQILDENGDMYIDDGTTELFSIFDNKEGHLLQKGDRPKKIGFYVNSGTLLHEIVCDLESRNYYVDDAVPHNIEDRVYDDLYNLGDKYIVNKWESRYEEKESHSTGSFEWILAFDIGNENVCVYSGYTDDMSCLPPDFNEVETIFYDLILNPIKIDIFATKAAEW